MWFCKICGFNTILAQGIPSYTLCQPQCPCVEIQIGETESQNRTER